MAKVSKGMCGVPMGYKGRKVSIGSNIDTAYCCCSDSCRAIHFDQNKGHLLQCETGCTQVLDCKNCD